MSNRLSVLAVEIRRAHAEAQHAASTAAERAIEAGQALLEAKSLVAHGGWLPWLRENVGISPRAAQGYMQLAQSGVKCATVAHLGLRAALAAIVAPEAKRVHVANNSGATEWYSPPEFLEVARAVLGGFDLDPASSQIANRTVQAERFFTAEDDGLSQEWPIGRIWMNPPYGQPLIAQFASRFAAEVRRGSTGIVLVNNATETSWFQELAAECSAICFPRTRIRFLDTEGSPSNAPLQGQAVIYCGPEPSEFQEAFSSFGLVVTNPSPLPGIADRPPPSSSGRNRRLRTRCAIETLDRAFRTNETRSERLSDTCKKASGHGDRPASASA